VNLFRHSLAILIILSWVMGIATVVLFLIPDIYWLSAIGLLGFVFFRESIPGPNRKW
jgi:hypothetical protein